MSTRWGWFLVVVGAALAGCAGPGATVPPDDVAPALSATARPATGTPTATKGAQAGPTPTVDPTSAAFYSSFELPSKGDPGAPVTVYEFSDYLCPFCAQYVSETTAAMDRLYVSTGKVRVLFYDYPIPSHGLPAIVAHEAAQCAGEQSLYWPMHDAIFARQADLSALAATDEAGARAVLAEIGAAVGAEADPFVACLESERYRPILAGLADAAQARGIEMTPTLMIVTAGSQDPLAGYVPLDELRGRLDAALARASSSSGTPGTPGAVTPGTPAAGAPRPPAAVTPGTPDARTPTR